jgi:hypothetical protein
MLGMAKTRQDDDFSLLQNSSQITFARSYPKMAEFLPSIMSLQVTAPYYVTVGETTPSTLVRRTPSDSQHL